MNVKTGVDRIWKVLSWMSFIVVLGVGALMYLGFDRSGQHNYGFDIVWMTLLTAYVLHHSESIYLRVFIYWYNLIVVSIIAEHPEFPWVSDILIYFAPLALAAIMWAILKYVVRGFTSPKT